MKRISQTQYDDIVCFIMDNLLEDQQEYANQWSRIRNIVDEALVWAMEEIYTYTEEL